MIHKIISGGQTGADQGGLFAAVKRHIQTGGWTPKGWLTEEGPALWLVDMGLQECDGGYKTRTHLNVRDSDATIRFASHWSSRGEICTLNAIKKFGKPHCDVTADIDCPIGETIPSFETVVKWIRENDVQVLNVAGNRESTCPGIRRFVTGYLVEVLRLL